MYKLKMNSSQRKFFFLLLCTFFVGTMITIVNYNQNYDLSKKHYVLSDSDRLALVNYYKSSQLKRSLIADNQIEKITFKLLKSLKTDSVLSNQSDLNDKQKLKQTDIITDKITNKNSASDLTSSNQNEQNDQVIKLSSTTFSDISSNKQVSEKKIILPSTEKKTNDKSSDIIIKKDEKQIDSTNNKLELKSSKKSVTVSPPVQDSRKNISSSAINKQKTNKLNSNKNLTYVHSNDEVQLTKKFIIDKNNFCSKDHGFGIDLIVMVVSSPNNFEARNAIRQTWGGFSIERGSKLLFVIGQSAVPEINEKIKNEDNQFDDILQGQYQDAYYNLTLKSLSIINWINDNCEKAKYVLKVDDDMFVNMQLLVNFAETREFKNVIIGKIAKKWLPHRDSNSKWYVPNTAYSGQVYPNFATGPAYLIHREAIPNLIKVIRSNSTHVIKLEDVFLAGIIAEKAGVRRLNYSLFKNAYFEVNKCNFMRFITSHQHSPKEILRLWKAVYSEQKIDCTVKKPSTKSPVKKEQSKPQSKNVANSSNS